MVYLWVTMAYICYDCGYSYEHVCVRYMFHMKGHTAVDPGLWQDRAEVLSREGGDMITQGPRVWREMLVVQEDYSIYIVPTII
jgi:hypothetical protein